MDEISENVDAMRNINSYGVDGYMPPADKERAERFPMPTEVNRFYQDFCQSRGIKPEDIPLTVELSLADKDDMEPLVRAGVVMVFEKYNLSYKDTEGLSVKAPPNNQLLVAKGNGNEIIRVESYDEKDDTIYVSNRVGLGDNELRDQLEKAYNIPASASEDYVMLYLVTHSAVHHIQKREGRLEKKPVGNGGDYTQAYLSLATEKEAHSKAIEITDAIWKDVVRKHGET